jgi:hypothetical protein
MSLVKNCYKIAVMHLRPDLGNAVQSLIWKESIARLYLMILGSLQAQGEALTVGTVTGYVPDAGFARATIVTTSVEMS